MDDIHKINPGVLSLVIKDTSVLYTVYMPFLKDGGLFIPTTRSFKMGEEVSMLLTLIDENEKYPVTGTIVWLTPKGSQGNRAPGVGVQFSGEQGKRVKDKIELALKGTVKSDRPTHTL